MEVRIDGWMDGFWKISGWVDGWMNGWVVLMCGWVVWIRWVCLGFSLVGWIWVD